jgi:recombinational DNA repair protein (RecF pathway)
MQEFVTEAITLDCNPHGDFDSRMLLFTKRYGKLHARAKSIRKATSKLAGHLIIGSVATVRIVEKHGFQVVDAFISSRLRVQPPDLHHLGYLLAENEPDLRIWNALTTTPFVWATILRLLGWDPRGARCCMCMRSNPEYFQTTTQEFTCYSCLPASKNRHSALVYVNLRS